MGGSIRIVYVHAQPRVFMNDEKAVRECARSEHRRFECRTGKSRLHRVHVVSKVGHHSRVFLVGLVLLLAGATAQAGSRRRTYVLDPAITFFFWFTARAALVYVGGGEVL